MYILNKEGFCTYVQHNNTQNIYLKIHMSFFPHVPFFPAHFPPLSLIFQYFSRKCYEHNKTCQGAYSRCSCIICSFNLGVLHWLSCIALINISSAFFNSHVSTYRVNSVAHTGSLTAYQTEIVPSFALAQYCGNQVLDSICQSYCMIRSIPKFSNVLNHRSCCPVCLAVYWTLISMQTLVISLGLKWIL